MKKAELLSELSQATEPTPLDGDDIDNFYVPADIARDRMLPPTSMLHDFLQDKSKPVRLLFASLPGAGKSTELNRLMRDAQESFWFVKLAAHQSVDLATLTYIDLIVAMIEKIYKQGRENNFIRDEKAIHGVRNWLGEIVREAKLVHKEEFESEAGVGIDGVLAQIIGLFAKLRAAFSLSYESAETVRQVLKPRIADMRQYCNQALADVESNLYNKFPNRRLLIIVEDTDKLEVQTARDIFVNHTNLLSDLETNIIYTVPLFLVQSKDRGQLERYFKVLTLPMIKTHTPKGERFLEGWEVLSKIIERRINVSKLITPDALDLVIEKTGGIIRDLLAVIQQAGFVAQYTNEDVISLDSMKYSLDKLMDRYVSSVYGTNKVTTDELYLKLKSVALARGKKIPPDDIIQFLLYIQAIIEYNGRGWFDLHPLMRDAMEDMGYFDDLAE